MKSSLLMIDNYDSFTYNLVQMFRAFPLEIAVFRADKITVKEVNQLSPDYIVISPGPGEPSTAGISVELIRKLHTTIPILGVCLGMQCINEAFGGKTVRAPLPMHGKTSFIQHPGTGLFRGVALPTVVARYHSLIIDDIHDDLEVIASTEDGVPMAISHRSGKLHGVQFHPESFLTGQGATIIRNFLRLGPLREQLP